MTLSTAATVSLYIVLVFEVIFALLTVVLLAVIAYSLYKLQIKVDETLIKVEPILAQTTQTLDTVQRVTSNIGERADTILSRGEELTENLANKAESTASVVHHAVTKPLINISSIIAGVTETIASLSRNFSNLRTSNSESEGE